MVKQIIASSSLHVADLKAALPKIKGNHRRSRPVATTKPIPSSLPLCFAEIWRRRTSNLPAHRRERASLEAVASTLPEEARSLTGEAAAAVYLAALLLSLERLVASTKPVRALNHSQNDATQISKKEKKRIRKEKREAEKAVGEMSTSQAIAATKPSENDTSMIDDDAGKDVSVNEDIDLIANLVYLVALATSGCSRAILSAKGEQVVDIIMRTYDHVGGHHLVARHTSQVYATVLAIIGSSAWSNLTMQRTFLYLLRQTTESENKLRKKAREALQALFNCPRGTIIRARTSSTMAGHYVSELKLYESVLSSSSEVGRETFQATPLIHVLTSIEMFSSFLRPQDASRVAKELVLIVSKNQLGVTSFAYQALTSLVSRRGSKAGHDPSTDEKPQRIPQTDLGKLVLAILQYELPDEPSGDLRIAYAKCVHAGSSAYNSYFVHSSPPDEFIVKPVRELFAIAVPTADLRVVRSVCGALRLLISQQWFKCRADVLQVIEGFLKKPFRQIWVEVLPVLKSYLETGMACASPQLSTAIKRLLKRLLELREKALEDDNRKEVDAAKSLIGAVARGGGASHILETSKLEYNEKEHVTNAWLLPILRDNMKGAPISLFKHVCLPLASKLDEVLVTLKSQKRVVEARNVSVYKSQVWSLLPASCTNPSDLGHEGSWNTAFQAIHLCLTADDQLGMYPNGIRGLRQLAMTIVALQSENPALLSLRTSFASRFKKLFANIAEVNEKLSEERRGMLLDAVTLCCKATNDHRIVTSLLKKAVRRLLDLQIEGSKSDLVESTMTDDDRSEKVRKQRAVADLAIAIAESKIIPLGASELGFLERALNPFFVNPKESALQKKAYRVSALVTSTQKDDPLSPEFSSLLEAISKASRTVAPGAKAARLSLITALADASLRVSTEDDRIEYLEKLNDMFLSEVIIGTRDVSEKTRAASFDALIVLARCWNACSPENDVAGLQKFFVAVMSGLGGRTVPMLAASLTALGRLMHDFVSEVSTNEDFRNLVDSLFGSPANPDTEMADRGPNSSKGVDRAGIEPGPVAVLLRHSGIEVQKAALGVVKVATKVLAEPRGRLASIVPAILPGLVHVAARSKKQETRLRVRVILERLMRKCGLEVLKAHFPAEHVRLLTAVRKKHSRDLVKKHVARDKRKEKIAAKRQNQDPNIESDGEDEKDDIFDDSDSDIERQILDGDELLKSGKRSHGSRSKPSDVLDLLEEQDRTAGNFETHPNPARPLQGKKRSSQTDKSIKYANDGRPIFIESDNESGNAEVGSANESSDDEGNLSMKRGSGRKRSRLDSGGRERPAKRVKGSFGEEYRSRRGAGDVKRAGRPEPYAYVPLGMEMMGPGTKPGLIGGKRNRSGSSLSRLVGNRGRKRRSKSFGVPGKR